MANTNRYAKEIELLCESWHRTAEQVHKEMKKTYRFIGIGSVYRNLNNLVQKDVLMRHHGIGDAVIYEKNKPFHGHIYCQNTDSIIDIDLSGINLDNLSLPEDFCLDEIQITIAGSFTWTDSPYCKIMGKVVRNKGFLSSLW